MKKSKWSQLFIAALIFIPLVFIFYVSSCSKVPAGHQGIIVNLYGSRKGVQERSVGVGRYLLSFNEELFLFPTYLQNYTWDKDEAITIQTSEGLAISADIGITYMIRPENVSKVFQKYRLGVDEITKTFLRNNVRDAMNKVSSTMTAEELYGEKKETFIKHVNELTKDSTRKDGIDIEKIYMVGSFRLPSMVVDSINAKIQATQNALKVQNEVATAKAEAQKLIIEAQARAQANDIVQKTLTPEFIRYQEVQKWNGVLPKVTGGNNLISVPLEDKK